jgi:hypothetical protein
MIKLSRQERQLFHGAKIMWCFVDDRHTKISSEMRRSTLNGKGDLERSLNIIQVKCHPFTYPDSCQIWNQEDLNKIEEHTCGIQKYRNVMHSWFYGMQEVKDMTWNVMKNFYMILLISIWHWFLCDRKQFSEALMWSYYNRNDKI